MNIVSPGVFAVERDFSVYAAQLAQAIFAIVTTASKGPLNDPTLITDVGTLNAVFGKAAEPHYGLYAAEKYLAKGSILWVVRVAAYDAPADALVFKDGSGVTDTLSFAVPSSGSWANTVAVVLAEASVAGRYRVSIVDNGYTVEVFDNLLVGVANILDPNYITTRINGVSQYVTVTVLNDTQTTLTAASKTFTGGDDGAPADWGDIIGSAGSPPAVLATGLQCFRNAEAIDINLIAVPGCVDQAVDAELISICETRGDCMAILSTPDNLTVQEAVDWHNGEKDGWVDPVTNGRAPTAAFNTSYAALYYAWVQVFDPNVVNPDGTRGANVWISPEGHIAQIVAGMDTLWGAPMGFSRARLTDVLAVRHSPTQGERDYMYGPGNNVNPIVNFVGEGLVVWGQKTLQRASTDLDRINVRLMILQAKKIIATASRILVGEPNDEITWARFRNLTNPVMRDIQSRRGVTDFRVVCDATTNTPLVRARKQMIGRIFIQATETSEMVLIEFTLLPQGASFTELVA